MKILYCHDNFYFRTENGQVFSQGQFHHSYWAPFLEIFGHLTVAGRGDMLPENLDTSKMNISSCEHVDFELLPNMNSPAGLLKHKAFVEKQVARMVAEHDGIIIRAVSEIGWLAFLEAKKQGKPIAMEMAACAWDSTWNHGNILGRVYAPLRMYHDRRITAAADFVLYVSRDFLPARYPTNGQVEFASNVRIDPAPQEVLDRRFERIKSVNSGGNPFVIGLIGTLSHKLKGVHDALKAIAVMRQKTGRDFCFRHLGPGAPESYKELAQALGLSDTAHFDGMVPSGDAVLQWLDGVDLYIQPSYQEGVPRAMIEAMSRGCPAIGSTAGGIPELLSREWLHEPGDYKDLANLMLRMMEDSQAQIHMANTNFALAKTYTSDMLMPRRKAFWEAFRDHITSRGGIKVIVT
jgi:glycosyltransferase involved in cell wall biosynthesis